MTNEEREAWLAQRRLGIGSSDAAAVCGISSYTTPLEVALRKMKQIPELEETEPMRWGNILEEPIAKIYEAETGSELVKPVVPGTTQPLIISHPEHSVLLASVDRLNVKGPRSERIVEIKNIGTRSAKNWGKGSDEVADEYLVQVQHQMMCTGHKIADVAVLIGGQDFRIYTIHRHEAFIANLMSMELDFWEFIKKGETPPPDWGHASTPELIDSLYTPVNGLVIELSQEAGELAEKYELLGDQISEMTKQRKDYKAQLVFQMGEASRAELPDGRWLERNPTHTKAYSVEARDGFRFSVKAPKTAKR